MRPFVRARSGEAVRLTQAMAGKGTFWVTDPRDELPIRKGPGIAGIPEKTVMEVFNATAEKYSNEVIVS